MFNILDYADKLVVTKKTTSQIVFECPICQGKLCVNTKTTAYACYTKQCAAKDIRNKIAPYGNSPFSKSSAFTSHKKLKPIILPMDFPSNLNLLASTNVVKSNYKKYFSNKYASYVTETAYWYSKNHKVTRLDYLKDGKKVKDFFPSYLQGQSWVYGKSEDWLFFNENAIEDKSLNKGILMTEGEKTANFVCSLGYLAISPPGFGWTSSWLDPALKRLSTKVKAILYLQDNDQPGYSKARLVQELSWKQNLPCKTLNISKLWNDAFIGADIADAIDLFDKEEIVNWIIKSIE